MTATTTDPPALDTAISSSLRERCVGFVGPTARKGLVSLADQAVVSGTSFATTLLVGRLIGTEGLGLYTLAFSYVILSGVAQAAFILYPFTVLVQQTACRATYAHAALRQQLSFMALAAALPLLLGVGLLFTEHAASYGPIVWLAAIVAPFHSLRQFVRKYLLADLKVVPVLMLDAVVAGLQLGLLAGVALTVGLTPARALGCVALACGMGGIAWLYAARHAFVSRSDFVAPEISRHWSLGSWFFFTMLANIMGAHVGYWVLTLYCGAEQTGLFAAAVSAILLFNPFVLGFNNIFMPRAAQALAARGVGELRRVVRKSALVLCCTHGMFCLTLIVLDERIIQFFYGAEYSGYGWTITLLAVAAFVATIGHSADLGLRVLERSDKSFLSGLPGTLLMLLSLFLFVPAWGLPGAAAAILLGDVVTAVGQILVYRRHVAFQESTRSVALNPGGVS